MNDHWTFYLLLVVLIAGALGWAIFRCRHDYERLGFRSDASGTYTIYRCKECGHVKYDYH